MDDYEKSFYIKQDKVNNFEKDLKAVFEKHKAKLVRDVSSWHGGSKDVIEVYIDSERWNIDDFEEILLKIKVIE